MTASPLWSQQTVPSAPAGVGGDDGPLFPQYPGVKGIKVPAGGIKDIPVLDLLRRDSSAPKLIPASLENCPGAKCGLRKPVYRDVTGDGRVELLVAVDDHSVGMTLLEVYRASRGEVRPILVTWGRLGLTGLTYGHDLVLTSTGDDGQLTTRYRWNGRAMTAAVPQDEFPTPADRGPASTSPTHPQTRTPSR